jgi:serine phosphatase RsbU (regulator of sigma subunit)
MPLADFGIPSRVIDIAHPGRTVRERQGWVLLAVVLLAIAFVADCASGSEVSTSLLYVVAIGVGAWFAGRAAGVLLAAISVVSWAAAYRLVGHPFSKVAIFYWNLGADFAIYLVTAVAVAGASEALESQRRLSRELAASHEALDRETRAVGELQRSMLPAVPPRVPGYEWQVHYATSSRAGGDYYDFFALPDDRVGVLLADASGHGPQAAVIVGMLRVLLHANGEALASPSHTLAHLNQQLAASLPSGVFVTAFYGVLDPGSGRLTYSLAGHDPPFVLRAIGVEPQTIPACGGLPLGVPTSIGYQSGTITLGPGDTLLASTDGLPEAMSPTREFFGPERIAQALCESRINGLAAVLTNIVARLDEHLAGTPIADDVTILLLRRDAGRMS